MDDFSELSEALKKIEPEKYEALPDIELYMDQLTDYLSRTPFSLRQDGRLTGAMVNNYIKSGLLPRARGKRYSREHIADLGMIVRLKQVLSVTDTGELLGLARRESGDGCYDRFCDVLHECACELEEKLAGADCGAGELAMELALDSYVKKAACEYILGILKDQEK